VTGILNSIGGDGHERHGGFCVRGHRPDVHHFVRAGRRVRRWRLPVGSVAVVMWLLAWPVVALLVCLALGAIVRHGGSTL
jgi:hypothetical protein